MTPQEFREARADRARREKAVRRVAGGLGFRLRKVRGFDAWAVIQVIDFTGKHPEREGKALALGWPFERVEHLIGGLDAERARRQRAG